MRVFKSTEGRLTTIVLEELVIIGLLWRIVALLGGWGLGN